MSRLVRHRATMLVAAAFVAALVLSAWLGDRGPADPPPHDPANPAATRWGPRRSAG